MRSGLSEWTTLIFFKWLLKLIDLRGMVSTERGVVSKLDLRGVVSTEDTEEIWKAVKEEAINKVKGRANR